MFASLISAIIYEEIALVNQQLEHVFDSFVPQRVVAIGVLRLFLVQVRL